MDYRKTAQEILSAIGGAGNLASAAHCATRLRLVIADNAAVKKTVLENIDGVKGVFEASGQLQIILGTGTVNKVFDEFISIAGIEASTKDELKKVAASKAPWYQRAIKTLGDIFVPIIPAIVASGLLMGLLEGFAKLFPDMVNSGTYTIFHLFSSAAFAFLPILIAFSAARVFGGNPFLGAVIGMIMIHGDLLNAWSVSSVEAIPTASVWFGLYDINLVGYQGHVIPVVVAVWFMSFIEKKLHKIVPEMIDLFVTPLVTVLATGYFTLTVFGPVFSLLENGVLDAVKYLIALPLGIGGAICGAGYAPTVVGGIHHMYNALEAGFLSADGINTWMPIATAANVAQGAAALAFSFKTRDTKQRAIALPASLSAFLGITEPAIFGVNLRFMKPFIAGCIGGAAGGLAAGVLHVSASAYGITGVFGILITTHNLWQYLIVMGVAFAVAFMVTAVLYREKKADEPKQDDSVADLSDGYTVAAPLSGKTVRLSDVPDPTFADEILGKGIAIEPSEGVVVAPGDGIISTIFDTHHAVGLTLDSGLEVLIHVGINTVELKGKGFAASVKEGDRVKKGQTLITFDLEHIRQSGYAVITPVLISNPEDFAEIKTMADGNVTKGAPLLAAAKGEA